MPIVTFLPSGKTFEVAEGTLLFDAAMNAGLPVASSCGAEQVCGRCNMSVILGADNLSPRREWENQLLSRDKKPKTDRISCMTKIMGDCTVTTTYW